MKKKLLSLLMSAVVLVSSIIVPLSAVAANPDKVSSFKISSVSKTSVKLKWSKVSKAQGYCLQYYSNSKKKWITAKWIPRKQTSASIGKLSSGVRYHFKIRSYKVSGKNKIYSSPSNLYAYTKPEKMSALKLKDNGSSKTPGISISWKKQKCTGYQIQYSTDAKFKNPKYIYSNKSVNKWHIYNTKKATYYVRIRAYVYNNSKKVFGDFSDKKAIKRTSDDSNVNYRLYDYYCFKDSSKIYGKLYLPKDSGKKYPIVILSHSFAMTHESMHSYCKSLAQNGYAAYAFDFCGGSNNSQSDGKMEDMTVFTEIDDLNAVVKKVKKASFADSKNIFLMGTSQGGLVSALCANKKSSQIKGLILLYPSFNTAEQATEKYKGKSIPDKVTTPFGTTGREYIKTMIGYDVYKNIKDFKNNVIIFHGTADNIVDISYSKRALKVYKKAKLITIQGAGHGFNPDNYSFRNYDSKVFSEMYKYLEHNL